jgi:hypothetical protein
MLTQFVGSDVLFVTAKVTDEGPNIDPPSGDSIADPSETVKLDISVVNSVLDVQREKPDLEDVTITLVANVANVGPDKPIACILDGSSFYGTLESGIARFNDPADPFRFVVGDVTRTSPSEVLQAAFSLGISGRYTDSLGVERFVTSFATPQRFVLNLDLDILNTALPLIGTAACEGGNEAGLACPPTVCTGFKDPPANTIPATCEPLPAYLQPGGTGFVAGEVGYFEGFEGSTHMGGRNFTTGPFPVLIPGTSVVHSPALNSSGGYLDGNALDFMPGPLSPSASPGNAPDDPQGSSGTDGIRCQYNDPRGPSKHPRSEAQARPWDGSEWHANDTKAFSGSLSLYGGHDGAFDLGADNSYDSNAMNTMCAAFTNQVNIGVAGNATMSIYHIIQMADDRTFNVPAGNAVGRGIIEWAEVDVTGVPISGWNKLNGFQNNYGNTGVLQFFVNTIFDSYDEFYDAENALGATPGWNPTAKNQVGVQYNADDIGSEDDYFDPNDPQRLYGPSGSCFPQFTYASLGDWTSTNVKNSGKAFTDGELGSVGTGVWVNSLFNLDAAGGKTIRVRFVLEDLDFIVGLPWTAAFGNRLGNAFRGWRIDDIAMSGLVDTPLQLGVDARTPGVPACPVDPDPLTPENEAACDTMTADAGVDVISDVSGGAVVLDGSASFANQCVDGFLEFRWRIGGQIVQDYSTEATLFDGPVLTTLYTMDVRCSTDPACAASDSVLVVPEDQGEISGVPGELGWITDNGPVPVVQSTTMTWTEPVVAGPYSQIRGYGVQVAHTGSGGLYDLRALAGGRTATPGAMSTALLGGLCDFGAATPGPGAREHQVTDSIVDLPNPGEVFGYLASGTNAAGVIGSLGRGEQVGPPVGFSRGRVKPLTVGACPP